MFPVLYRLLPISVALLVSSFSLAQEPKCPFCPAPATPICALNIEGNDAIPQVVGGCEASVTSNWNDGWMSDTCNASVPRGTALIEPVLTIYSQSNGGHSVSRYTKGSLKFTQDIDDAYKSLYEMALELDATYAARIKQDWERHRKIAETWEGTDDAARLTITAKGSGEWWDKWRGWFHAKVDLKVVCLAPANLREQLDKKYSFNSYASKSKQYVTVLNDGPKQLFGLAQPLPFGKKDCSEAAGMSSGFLLQPNEQLNFRVNNDIIKLENEGMCVVMSSTSAPGYADFKRACPMRISNLSKTSDSSFAKCIIN